MGNLWEKLLQRAVPAMKEHQRTIEILTNQNRILKRILVLGGLFAVAGLLYIKTHPHLEVREEESDQESDVEVVERPVIEILDSLECIICMENLKEVMLEPCGHVCICRACAERLRLPSGRVKCPVCVQGRAERNKFGKVWQHVCARPWDCPTRRR